MYKQQQQHQDPKPWFVYPKNNKEEILMAQDKIKNPQDLVEVEEAKVDTPEMTPEMLLEKQMIAYPNVTIRRLANTLGISYGRLLKASRAPQAGVMYDPEATNYIALAEILGVDRILDAPWEDMNDTAREGGGATAKDMSIFQVGQKVYLRRDNDVPFEIIHITQTHIVLQQVETETPYCWQHGTFLINGPVFEPRTKRVVDKAAKQPVDKDKAPKQNAATTRAFAIGSEEKPWVD